MSAPLPGGLACRCRPLHRGQPLDVGALNRPALERLAAWREAPREVDCLIVPGYTPRFGWRRDLHPKARQRVALAAADLAAGVAPLCIVSGGAVHSRDNEAWLMRGELLARGVDPSRILIEPCARHTTTNLRNAGRLMLALGLTVAYVVTSDASPRSPRRLLEQAFYVGHPIRSSFHLRCLFRLGFVVGELGWVRPHHVRFVPAPACARGSRYATREGDP